MLPLDVMPVGHTYSIGFTQMYAPTPSRRRVGAYVLHVCPDTTTPISQLDIHQDLVTFGGFTSATGDWLWWTANHLQTLLDPVSPGYQTVPLHTPALGFGSFPSTFPAPSTSSSLSTSTATASVSAASTVVVSTPPISQLVTVPHFDAIVVPPVITFNQSPPARSHVSESSYQVLSVPLSPSNSTEATSPTSSASAPVTHTPTVPSTTAPILQWPSFPASGPPSSMPVLDASSVPFSGLTMHPRQHFCYNLAIPFCLSSLLYQTSGTYTCLLSPDSRLYSTISVLPASSPPFSCFYSVSSS